MMQASSSSTSSPNTLQGQQQQQQQQHQHQHQQRQAHGHGQGQGQHDRLMQLYSATTGELGVRGVGMGLGGEAAPVSTAMLHYERAADDLNIGASVAAGSGSASIGSTAGPGSVLVRKGRPASRTSVSADPEDENDNDDDNDSHNDNDDDPAAKKRRRNTEAARRSRLRKLQKVCPPTRPKNFLHLLLFAPLQVESLDSTVRALQADKKDLEVKVAVLENEKLTLLSRQKDLMERVGTLEQHLHEAHQAMLKMNSLAGKH
ncbi:hypothetical protein HK100_005855 [Physocladia obscura]|uniref:BZIP domain-containing protein n=1 Tax=Physocladia obscura TaxID=109957 RepID=A0AAD5XGB9_9FUNG|nr:hypothetical protein HK100_005855 [Physocladia obscura]